MSDDWVRPGPDSIEPGQCPDGLVFHVYGVPDGTLLRVSKVDITNVEEVAPGDALACGLIHPGPFCLVVYDGDSGERTGPPPPGWL